MRKILKKSILNLPLLWRGWGGGFLLLPLFAFAQPAAVKTVQQSVLTVTTYGKDGSLLAQTNGVFLGAEGEAIAPFKPFAGAYKAVVADCNGNQTTDIKLLGANEMHNVIHFKANITPAEPVAKKKKKQPEAQPAVAAQTPVAKGGKLFCVGAKAIGEIQKAVVKDVETFAEKYSYYIIDQTVAAGYEGCPMVTEAGEVVGLMETSQTTANVFAADARYALSLQPHSLVATDPSLIQVHLPVALPADEGSARIAMMMLATGDSIKFATAARDFMTAYPSLIDGYPIVASQLVGGGDCQAADEVMAQALENVGDKAAANYEYGKLIYNKLLYSPQLSYEQWTADKAVAYIRQAHDIAPSGMYKNTEAQILFSQQRYAAADSIFALIVDDKDVSKSEIYYERARCRQALGAKNEEVLELLDSAVNNVDTLALTSAAPYYWMRGRMYDIMGKYRDAVFDYSRYQILMNNRVNEAFYYTRFTAEVNARLYQQALIDIQNCIITNPKELQYPAEKAQLELRVGLAEQAVQSASYCITLAPDNSMGYTLLALAQAQLGKKDDALKNFLKAKELGDEKADEYIKKYVASP